MKEKMFVKLGTRCYITTTSCVRSRTKQFRDDFCWHAFFLLFLRSSESEKSSVYEAILWKSQHSLLLHNRRREKKLNNQITNEWKSENWEKYSVCVWIWSERVTMFLLICTIILIICAVKYIFRNKALYNFADQIPGPKAYGKVRRNIEITENLNLVSK